MIILQSSGTGHCLVRGTGTAVDCLHPEILSSKSTSSDSLSGGQIQYIVSG